MSNRIDRRTVLGAATAGAIAAMLKSAYAASLSDGAAANRASAAAGAAGKRAFGANQTITTLMPGRLYRIGCVVRAERLSWLASDLDAYEPLNAYLLVDEENAVFIDVGMPIAQPALQLALDQLIADRKVWASFTRNEADCIGNLGYVLGSVRDPTLLFGSAGGILEWINDPSVSILEVRDFLGRIPIEYSRNGTSRDIGSLGLSWFDAGLKQMIMTQWAYEKSSGCLFSSESFGFRHLKHVDSSPVIESARDLPSVDTVAREIVARANWLREADYPEVIERFQSIFEEYDVRMIAPVHGCVIKGRDAVAAHVKLTVNALRAASKLPDHERMQYV